PMTLKTMFRIGKLQYLFNNSEGAMEILGDTLAKQEKLLGFDHAEATLTRDLLNEILSEKATARVTLESNETMIAEHSDTSLIDFLEEFEKSEVPLEKRYSTRPPDLWDSNQTSSSVKFLEYHREGEGEGEKDAGFFQSLKNRLLPGNEDGVESDPSETEQ
ncbi:MAG: hypothetical protein VW622_10045, partial [Opitutae bacterium]